MGSQRRELLLLQAAVGGAAVARELKAPSILLWIKSRS